MSTLAHELKVDESKPTSFATISRILEGRVSGLRMTYVDLINHKGQYTVESILGSHNAAAILLTVIVPGSKVQQRHWTLLIRQKNSRKGNEFQFFDSLAIKPQSLTRLLNDNGKFVNFLKRIKAKLSVKQLQEDIKKVRTCGAWISVRAAKYKLTNAEFVRWILSERNSTGDITVIRLCYLGLLT